MLVGLASCFFQFVLHVIYLFVYIISFQFGDDHNQTWSGGMMHGTSFSLKSMSISLTFLFSNCKDRLQEDQT